jgi:hypothetical protein
MQLSVKQFVKLKEYQEQRTRELWCEEQQQDFQRLIDLMEDVSSSSFDAAKSSQGYASMQYSKHVFTSTLLKIAEHYRYVNSVHIKRNTDTQTDVG